MNKKKCLICRAIFYVPNYRKKTAKYCSHMCSFRGQLLKGSLRRKTGIIKNCIACGKPFYQPKCHNQVKTCSKKCGFTIRRNKGGRKLGIREKRKCINCHKEYKIASNSLRNKKYCSRKCWKDFIKKFAKYPQQQRLQSAEWIKLRKEVLKRQNNKCWFCNNKGTEVHHIEPYSISGNNKLENLMLLCKSCHLSLHNILRIAIEKGFTITNKCLDV